MDTNSERIKKILDLLRDLKEANKEIPVIVEGKRDREALRELGIEGAVIVVHCGKSIYDFCEEILSRHDRFIILTDWDQRGEMLSRKIRSNLKDHHEGCDIFRKRLATLCLPGIREVEDLPRLLRSKSNTGPS